MVQDASTPWATNLSVQTWYTASGVFSKSLRAPIKTNPQGQGNGSAGMGVCGQAWDPWAMC